MAVVDVWTWISGHIWFFFKTFSVYTIKKRKVIFGCVRLWNFQVFITSVTSISSCCLLILNDTKPQLKRRFRLFRENPPAASARRSWFYQELSAVMLRAVGAGRWVREDSRLQEAASAAVSGCACMNSSLLSVCISSSSPAQLPSFTLPRILI